MYVLMDGKVGLYNGRYLEQEVTVNQVFGMDFNRIETYMTANDNNRVRHTTAIALVPTICLSLDFSSYID